MSLTERVDGFVRRSLVKAVCKSLSQQIKEMRCDGELEETVLVAIPPVAKMPHLTSYGADMLMLVLSFGFRFCFLRVSATVESSRPGENVFITEVSDERDSSLPDILAGAVFMFTSHFAGKISYSISKHE